MTAGDLRPLLGRSFPPVLAALILFGTPARTPAADKPAPLERDKVWQVHLTLTADEYAAIQPRGVRTFGPRPKEPEKPADPNREVHKSQFGADLAWGAAAVAIGNQTFEKVGVRYKGNGTIMDTSRALKKSFKIDLDRAGGSARFAGSKTINLNCGVTDPTKLREALAYDVYRAAGVPAARTTFAEVRLTVPGKYDKELLGFYTVVEEADKPFLKDRFGTDKGLVMKPEGLRDFTDLGDDWDRYKKAYAPKRDATPEEGKRLVAFAKLVDKADDATFRKDIESYLDVDNYLRFMAATAFLANTDSFFDLGHNYYLHLNPKTNKLQFLPWDLDRAFANFGNATRNMDLSLIHPYGGTHKLTERLLAAPGVAERYQKLFKELAGTAFAKDRLLKELAAVEKATADARAADAKAATARKEVSGPGFFGVPPELSAFVQTRTESITAQLDGKSKGFIPQRFGFGPKK